jgi:hypothetical protein
MADLLQRLIDANIAIDSRSPLDALAILRGNPRLRYSRHRPDDAGSDGTQLAEIVAIELPDLPVLLVSGYAKLPEGNRRLHILAKPFTHWSTPSAIRSAIRTLVLWYIRITATEQRVANCP